MTAFFMMILLTALSACISPQEAAPPPRPETRVTTTPPPTSPYTNKPVAKGTQDTTIRRRISATAPTVRVGMLLPLSNESRAIGESMLDAATLALYDYYLPMQESEITANVVLLPKDTGNTVSSAAKAAEQVLSQQADLIIGPVFSAATSSVMPITTQKGVPMISLSNDVSVASDDVYVFGYLPSQQVSRMVDYLALQEIGSIGAILPNDAYGQKVADTLKSTLARRGIRTSTVEFYARTEENMSAAVLRLKQAYDTRPFDALFIAEGGETLDQLISALQAQQLNSNTVRYVGTGLWDDEDVQKIPALKTAWYTSTPYDYYHRFEKRFMAVYGYKPQRIASLAYDAVTLTAALSLAAHGSNFGEAVLSAPQGFIGPANGLYRLHENGLSERGLMVMEITGGAPKTLDPAPTRFKE